MNQRQLFLEYVAQTSPSPLMLEIERAEGVYLYGKDGKQYLDMISGISVSNVGHCHPEVVKAIQEQSAKFMHLMVYGEYIYSPQVKLAEKLNSLLPDSLDNFYFTNSGTEAVEGTLKLAKRYTGKTEVISCYNAYHGSTAGSLSAMGSEDYKTAYRPLVPNHRLIHYGDEAELNQINSETACVLIEVVQGESGVNFANKEYFEKLRKRCDEVGCLLIFDEIQTGMGRTGKMFAFEHIEVIPDVLLIGKGFGGGMPIAAFIANKEKMQVLSHNPILGHISTFGGNAVCCAAALATTEIIAKSEFLAEIEPKGKYIEDKLIGLGMEVRRKGLFMAIDFKNQDKNFAIIDRCIERGIITDWFLFNTQSMRLCPPLTITYEEIDSFLAIFESTLKNAI